MNQVYASIITIGDELLIGQTIDTNSAFIAQELNRAGIWVRRRIAIGDHAADIKNTLDEESRFSDVLILTGGLGPTADDITKPALCEYFGGKLVTDEKVLAHVIYLFEKIYRRPGPILERNLKQAEVPDVCTVLHNERGTAPGMLFRKDGKLYFSLPGVPHEMKGLLLNQVIPVLLKELTMPYILHKTVFTAGQGESVIAELLRDFESSLPARIKLAYLPNYGMVRLRLSSTGSNKEATEKEMLPYFEKLQELVREYMVTNEDEELEVVIGKILKMKGKTMATAESCTGGYIASLITAVPGSSAYYTGSVVSYANQVKENLLAVKHDTLMAHGAVSEETVKEMVAGALNALGTDYALAVSGIMGPEGGTEAKPVGTVWMAAGNKNNMTTQQLHLRFDRQRNIMMTAGYALNFFRKFIIAND